MKIQSSLGSVGYPTVARDRQNDSSNPHDHPEGQKRQNPGSENPEEATKTEEEALSPQATQDRVGEELPAFQQDIEALPGGLNASVIGTGPGLKVVLKDGQGSVIRQFTGEEFLKLREAATQVGRTSGKILDRKL